MSKRIWILFLILCFAVPASAKIPFLMATSTIGGGDGALDKIDGQGLQDGYAAVVITTTGTTFYLLDADSGATESDPDIIAPDTNAGDKRWILSPARPAEATTTQLESATSDINTVGKFVGKPVYNTTTGIMVYASGTDATDKWKEADGTDEHTPS